MALQKSDDQLGSGDLDRPLRFFTPAGGQNSDGSVSVDPVFAYRMLGNIAPLGRKANEVQTSGREMGELWAIVTVRFIPSRQPRESMTLVDVRSGDTWEVRAAAVLNSSNRKMELTCRRVR